MVQNFDKRIREITLKHSSLSGQISISNSKQVQFESSLERDFVYLIEFDTRIANFLEQPLKIPYYDDNGKSLSYTPDFIIEYYDSTIELIEIKYQKVLNENYDLLKSKFNAAYNFCNERNWKFRIITDEFIREQNNIKLINCKFLSRYKNYFNLNRKCNYSTTSMFLLYNTLKVLKTSTIKDLLFKIDNEGSNHPELIFLTWCLVADNFFTIDITKELSLETLVCYN